MGLLRSRRGKEEVSDKRSCGWVGDLKDYQPNVDANSNVVSLSSRRASRSVALAA